MITKESLIDDLYASVFGDPWYGPSIKRIYDTIPEETAFAKQFENIHSISELTLHMWAWTEEVRNRIEGKEPRQPEMGDWPDTKEYLNESWFSIKSKLYDSTRLLIESIKKTSDNKFLEKVGSQRDAPLGTGVTFDSMVMGLVQHNAYHAGQISILKKLMKE